MNTDIRVLRLWRWWCLKSSGLRRRVVLG